MSESAGEMVSEAQMTLDDGVPHLDAVRTDQFSEPLQFFVGVNEWLVHDVGSSCLVSMCGGRWAVSWALRFGSSIRSHQRRLSAWSRRTKRSITRSGDFVIVPTTRGCRRHTIERMDLSPMTCFVRFAGLLMVHFKGLTVDLMNPRIRLPQSVVAAIVLEGSPVAGPQVSSDASSTVSSAAGSDSRRSSGIGLTGANGGAICAGPQSLLGPSDCSQSI